MKTPNCYESNEDGWCDGCDEYRNETMWERNSPALKCITCALCQDRHRNYTIIDHSPSATSPSPTRPV